MDIVQTLKHETSSEHENCYALNSFRVSGERPFVDILFTLLLEILWDGFTTIGQISIHDVLLSLVH